MRRRKRTKVVVFIMLACIMHHASKNGAVLRVVDAFLAVYVRTWYSTYGTVRRYRVTIYTHTKVKKKVHCTSTFFFYPLSTHNNKGWLATVLQVHATYYLQYPG